jgi:hypothetical protein
MARRARDGGRGALMPCQHASLEGTQGTHEGTHWGKVRNPNDAVRSLIEGLQNPAKGYTKGYRWREGLKVCKPGAHDTFGSRSDVCSRKLVANLPLMARKDHSAVHTLSPRRRRPGQVDRTAALQLHGLRRVERAHRHRTADPHAGHPRRHDPARPNTHLPGRDGHRRADCNSPACARRVFRHG